MVLLSEFATALLLTLPAILAGVAAIITAWRVGRKVEAVGSAVDGRLSQLLATSTAGAHAEGRLEGAAETSKAEDDAPKRAR